MFCKVNLLRSHKTIKEHVNCLKRYSKEMGDTIDANKIRDFLSKIRTKYPNPRTYRLYLCAFKVFCRDFLKREDWAKTLRFPRISPKIITDLPSKEQLRTFFSALPNDRAKTAFLVYCSSGLRKSEIFNAQILTGHRAIIPSNHEQFSTKNSYVSFYNAETEQYLQRIGFNLKIAEVSIRRWFKIASDKTKDSHYSANA